MLRMVPMLISSSHVERIFNISFPKDRERKRTTITNPFSNPFQFDVADATSCFADPVFYFAYLDTSMTTNKRAILVRLPEALVDRLDAVAYDLRMPSRNHYIHRSLERALAFSEAHEVPLVNDPAIQRALAR